MHAPTALLPGLIPALLLALAMPAVASPRWAAVPWPDGTMPQVVADDMRLNGQAVRLYRFERRSNVSTVAAQFQQALGQGARVTVVGQRHIVAAPLADTFVTVDLHPAGHGSVAGHVLQTHLDMPPRPPSPAMPPESRLWNHTESRDGPTTSTLYMLENQHSAAANHDFFRHRLHAQGLAAVRLQQAAAPRKATTTHFAGHGRSAVVLVEDWGTFRTVIVHHTQESP